MLMSRRCRGRFALINCHDECDGNMAPSRIKKLRRRMKRRERQNWQREISAE